MWSGPGTGGGGAGLGRTSFQTTVDESEGDKVVLGNPWTAKNVIPKSFNSLKDVVTLH